MKTKNISKISSAVLLVGACAWLWGSPTPATVSDTASVRETLQKVGVRDIDAGPVKQSFVLDGATRPYADTTLFSNNAGDLVEILVKSGDSVSKGQLLAQVENATQKAALKRAEADLKNAQSALERARKLSASGALSQATLDEREADLERQKETLETARSSLDQTRLLAPYDGVVVDIPAKQGEWVSPGDQIIRVADMRSLIGDAHVPQARVADLEVGQAVTVHFPDGKSKEGEISHIAPVADTNTRSYPVEVTIPNETGSLRAGSTVSMVVNHFIESAAVIPQEAIIISDDGAPGIHYVTEVGEVGFLPIDILSSTDKGIVVSTPQSSLTLMVGDNHLDRHRQASWPPPPAVGRA